jgi:hypothetical protein
MHFAPEKLPTSGWTVPMLCEYFSRSTCCVGPTPDQFADPKRQLRHVCGAIRNFAKRCFTESINAYLAGDTATGKAILRDLAGESPALLVAAIASGLLVLNPESSMLLHSLDAAPAEAEVFAVANPAPCSFL